MSVTNDNKFNFYDVKIISKNKDGKFYNQVIKNKCKVYEVSEEIFKGLLVCAMQSKNDGHEIEGQPSKFDYLFDQLEMNEALFTALLYNEWINENKE